MNAHAQMQNPFALGSTAPTGIALARAQLDRAATDRAMALNACRPAADAAAELARFAQSGACHPALPFNDDVVGDLVEALLNAIAIELRHPLANAPARSELLCALQACLTDFVTAGDKASDENGVTNA